VNHFQKTLARLRPTQLKCQIREFQGGIGGNSALRFLYAAAAPAIVKQGISVGKRVFALKITALFLKLYF
jgi:hypothetical protein